MLQRRFLQPPTNQPEGTLVSALLQFLHESVDIEVTLAKGPDKAGPVPTHGILADFRLICAAHDHEIQPPLDLRDDLGQPPGVAALDLVYELQRDADVIAVDLVGQC